MASDSPYLVLPGSNAFSKVKLVEKAAQLGAVELRALNIHYINPLRSLSDNEVQRLQKLLAYGTPANGSDELTLALVDALNRDSQGMDPLVLELSGNITDLTTNCSTQDLEIPAYPYSMCALEQEQYHHGVRKQATFLIGA
jgi:hypothetical protein